MEKNILKPIISLIFFTIIISVVFFNNIFFHSNESMTDSDYITYLLSKDFIYIFISLLVLFTSVVVTSVTIYSMCLKQKQSLLLGFSIFTLLTSIWGLCQIDFILYVTNGFKIAFYIQHYSLFLIPFSIILMSYSFIKNKIVHITTISIFTLSLLVKITIGIINEELINLMYSIEFILIITYMIVLIVLFLKIEEKHKNTVVFLEALVLTTLSFGLEFFNFSFNSHVKGVFLVVMILILFCITISHVVEEYINKENYRTYLSEENARLSSSILLSQIKPHFLYNALNSISYLCKKDPKQADMAVIRFSRYLRQNMKCIESLELVDFASEMEHIKNYLYLETIRFPKMEIIYELKYINFKVPPLCIQPIVENSVKHGVSKNTEGGYVIIKSYTTAKHIIIEISDNGPGFDTSVNMAGTGLSNISRRLRMLINAEIEFGSLVGKGTVVRVKIPREDVN